MSKISDTSVIDALRRQMTIAVAKQARRRESRQRRHAGLQGQEVTFSDALRSKLAPTNSTFPASRTSGPAVDITVKDAEGLPARRDGNTVQLDREL